MKRRYLFALILPLAIAISFTACEDCEEQNCSNLGNFNTETCACDCDAKYTGDNCQECKQAAADCVNGTFEAFPLCNCNCDEGWGGENCDQVVCADTLACQNGTIDFTTCACDCQVGYSGTLCETSHISNSYRIYNVTDSCNILNENTNQSTFQVYNYQVGVFIDTPQLHYYFDNFARTDDTLRLTKDSFASYLNGFQQLNGLYYYVNDGYVKPNNQGYYVPYTTEGPMKYNCKAHISPQ